MKWQLIRTSEMRRCNWPRCQELTYWRRPGQRRGTCVTHAIANASMGLPAILGVILAAFPGAAVSQEAPRVWRRGEYEGQWRWTLVRGHWQRSRAYSAEWIATPALDAGPCVGCGATVRRYGPDAYPFCYECNEVKT